jgi:hypothetical protein
MKKSTSILAGLFAVLLSVSGLSAGPKIEFGDDSYLQLSFLGQFHGQFLEHKDGLENDDVFMRRARIILAGQITDGIKVFAETDNANAGKKGNTSYTEIQDAFIDFRLGQSNHWVTAGLILLPFSFENRASAASLLGIDYNSEVVKFTNHFVWRDDGAMVHGSFRDKLGYFVGVFDGYENTATSMVSRGDSLVTTTSGKNPEAEVRVTGHVHFALLGEPQTGWFYAQDRLGKAGNYVLIGVGLDAQKKATLKTVTTQWFLPSPGSDTTTTVTDSENWVVDCQSGANLGTVDVVLNSAFYNWDNTYKGTTFFSEAGIRKSGAMLTFKYALQSPDEGDDVADYTYGLDYFFKGHAAVAGVEHRFGDSTSQVLCAVKFLL